MPTNITEEIEKLIDSTSLLDVVTALECVCGEKALHILHTWQDKVTAEPWQQAEKMIGRLTRQITDLQI